MGHFSYQPLWSILVDRDMTKEDLRQLINASPTTIATMGHGGDISFKVLKRICDVLKVQPGDVIFYVPDGCKEVLSFEPKESHENPE